MAHSPGSRRAPTLHHLPDIPQLPTPSFPDALGTTRSRQIEDPAGQVGLRGGDHQALDEHRHAGAARRGRALDRGGGQGGGVGHVVHESSF